MSRIAAWIQGHMPTRESLERSRLLRPVAGRLMQSDVWRFNRRSVPRGVALGLFVGVMIPLAHFVVVTFVALFVRANLPAALAATFVGFPVFYVFLVAAAYRIGEWLIHLDAVAPISPLSETMQATQTDALLQRITGAGLDTALGLFLIASVLAAAGYLIAGWVWRAKVARKRRQRLDAARARRAALSA